MTVLSLHSGLQHEIEEPLVDLLNEAMNPQIDAGVSRSVIPVLAELRSLSAKLEEFADIKSAEEIRRCWIFSTALGALGLTAGVVCLTLGVLKALGYL